MISPTVPVIWLGYEYTTQCQWLSFKVDRLVDELVADTTRVGALIDHQYANYAMLEILKLRDHLVLPILLQDFARHATAKYGHFVLKWAIAHASDERLTHFSDAFVADMVQRKMTARTGYHVHIQQDINYQLVQRKMTSLNERLERANPPW